jgi:hypothetical protein
VVTIYGRDNKPVVQLGDDYGVWEKKAGPIFLGIPGSRESSKRRMQIVDL